MQHLSKESLVCNVLCKIDGVPKWITRCLCLAGSFQSCPWGIPLLQHMPNLGNCSCRLFRVQFFMILTAMLLKSSLLDYYSWSEKYLLWTAVSIVLRDFLTSMGNKVERKGYLFWVMHRVFISSTVLSIVLVPQSVSRSVVVTENGILC